MQKYQTYGRHDDPQGEEADEQCFGVNQRLAADQLPAGLCAEAENARMRDGRPTTRLGTTRPGWLNVTRAGVDAVVNGVGPTRTGQGFYGVGSFKDPNGFEWILTAANGGVFRHKPHNGRTAVPLPTMVRILSEVTFCQGFNVVYCFRGKFLQPLVMGNVDTGFADLVPRWTAGASYLAAVLATGQVAQEVAYGPFQSISSLTSVGDLATCVTTVEHGYVSGADVVVQGAVEAGYNGRWNITVVDVNTFTFQFNGASASPATGPPKVSNMALYWKALGSQITLGAGEMTSAAGTATVTHTAHGFTTGQYATVTGAAQPEYNVTGALITVTGVNTFTFAITGAPASPATPLAGVAIKVRTSVVIAAQSPDTNAEAWQQIFNVLPNCDEAIFINNRTVAATSYTPGNTSYDSTSTYTKKDFLVAMDIGDLVHFDFVDEFRINQGGDDEIVQLLKAPSGAVNSQGLSTEALIVLKGKSWAVLAGLSGDLSQVTLDTHMDGYGECAPRGGVVAGRNLLFASSVRGICGLVQFQTGQARSVDIPFSNDVPGWISRIAWPVAGGANGKMRLAYWDDKLYVAAPVDDATVVIGDNLVLNGATYDVAEVGDTGVVAFWEVDGFEAGKTYVVTPGNSTKITGLPDPNAAALGVGRLEATQTTYYLWGTPAASVTATVEEVLAGVNNAVMVFDFRTPRISTPADANSPFIYETGEWASLDTGASLCVKEWFKVTYNGRERLGFIGEDGWANLMEESDAGDQLQDPLAGGGLSFEEIVLDWTSRGYREGGNNQKKWKWLELVLGVWNAAFDVYKLLPGAGNNAEAMVNQSPNVISGKSFSRTKYLKPAGKRDYVAGNGNGDFMTAGRGDYSMDLSSPLTLGAGVALGVMQEVVVRQSIRTMAGRYAQFRVVNRRGRMQVRAVGATAGEGQRRAGILI